MAAKIKHFFTDKHFETVQLYKKKEKIFLRNEGMHGHEFERVD